MKTAVKGLMAVVALFGVVAAATADDFRLGIIDAGKIMRTSKSGQQFTASLEKFVKERQEKFLQEQKKVQALQQDLEKNSLTLTDAQKDQKRKEIEEKIKSMRQIQHDAEDEVKKREGEFSVQLNKGLTEILEKIAKDKKLTLIIDRRAPGFYWAANDVDLTDEVVKAYDAKVPAAK